MNSRVKAWWKAPVLVIVGLVAFYIIVMAVHGNTTTTTATTTTVSRGGQAFAILPNGTIAYCTAKNVSICLDLGLETNRSKT